MSADVANDKREFTIAPEYRRSVFYGMAGCIVLAATAWWIETVYHIRGGVHVASTGFAICGAIMCIGLTFRLQFEGDGLIRRRLWFRDEWTWAEFSSGRIEKWFPYTFFDHERPWWRSRLSLNYLSEVDRKTVTSRINQHYRLPEPPDRVDELNVQYALRKTAKLRRGGIQIVDRGRVFTYRWSDVGHMQIVRMDPLRRDFQELNLVLADREISLRMIKGRPSWSGPTPEALSEFLLAQLPRDIATLDVYGERPQHPDDIQRELNRLKMEIRQFRVCMSVFVAAFVGAFILMCITGGWVGSAFGGAMVVMCALPSIFMHKEQVNELAQLELWLSEAKRV